MGYRVVASLRNGEKRTINPQPNTAENVAGWMDAHTCGNRQNCLYFLRFAGSYTADAPREE